MNSNLISRIDIKMEVVPIELDGIHLFVSGRINRKKARFLIDTGASRSVVDMKRISRFFPEGNLDMKKLDMLSTGLGTNTMESNALTLPLISFGRKTLRNYHMAALDLSHVNESYKLLRLPAIDGVIGGDLLWRFQAVIDYPLQTLRVSKA